jgi:GNAT superfamily N-acetyltransferase
VADRTRIREILSADDPSFRAAHELLRREFPHAEMLPVRVWRNALRERREGLWTDVNWHLLVAERNSELLAAASASYLGNVNAGIIGYIAVRPRARKLGLGPRMRAALRRKLEADARTSGHSALAALVGEVSRHNPWLRNLVRREGAIALDFPYYQPSLGTKHDPVPFVLYYQPLTSIRKSLSASELRRLLYTIWRRSYRVARPLSHVAFRRMLRSISGRRRIGQIPLDG